MFLEDKKIATKDKVELSLRLEECGASSWLILVHGIGEHCGRYDFLYKMFSGQYNLCFYDQRGHGKSGGRKGYISQFTDFSEDLNTVLLHLKEQYQMKKYVLFGHSMGGLVVADFLQNIATKDFYPSKVFLSSPAVAVPGLPSQLLYSLPLNISARLAGISSSLELKGLVDLKKLSHDSRVYHDYTSDPLCNLKLHTKLAIGLIHRSREVFSRPLRAQCPVYCYAGTEDVVVDYQAIKNYCGTLEKGIRFLSIDGGYHELHNELDKYRVPAMQFLKETLS